MVKKYQTFKGYLVEKLQDPQESQLFLNASLEAYAEDHDTKALLLALRYIVEAKGGVTLLAEKTKLSRQNLYKILTGKTLPRFDTMFIIIQGLGFELETKRFKSQ